jgi:spore coat polysaccharide biosynthesis predicted glycosyltransferase SpsG
VPSIVVLVADAGKEAGLGHVSRSSAIAVALRTRGLDTRCYAHGANAPFERDQVAWSPLGFGDLPSSSGHVLVIDTYRLPQDVLEQAAESSTVVMLHDHGPTPKNVALVVSTVATSPAVDVNTPRLAGLEYAALRPAFWGLPPRALRASVEQVLVTVGSGKFASTAVQFADAVADALPEVDVALVRGPYAECAGSERVTVIDSPASLLRHLLASDLAITAGGQTMLEAMATGTPCIAVALVANQQAQVAELATREAVELVQPPEPSRVAAAVVTLAETLETRRLLSLHAQRAIDGYGALRVAFQVAQLAEPDRVER